MDNLARRNLFNDRRNSSFTCKSVDDYVTDGSLACRKDSVGLVAYFQLRGHCLGEFAPRCSIRQDNEPVDFLKH